MSPQEMAGIVARIVALEGRSVDAGMVDVWYEVCDDLDYRDALDAVRRYHRERAKWMGTADLVEWSRVARQRRLQAEGMARAALPPTPEAEPATPEVARAMAERIRRDLVARKVLSDPPADAATVSA